MFYVDLYTMYLDPDQLYMRVGRGVLNNWGIGDRKLYYQKFCDKCLSKIFLEKVAALCFSLNFKLFRLKSTARGVGRKSRGYRTDDLCMYADQRTAHSIYWEQIYGFWIMVPQFCCFLEVLRMSKWWCSISTLKKSAFLWQLWVTQHDPSCRSKYPFKREIRYSKHLIIQLSLI